MIILLVLRVKLVEHLAVRDELLLMILKGNDDLGDVLFNLVILGAELRDVVAGFFEQTEEAAFLAFVYVKALQLGDEVGQHVGDRAGVLGLYVLQNLVGELGDLGLRGVAVFENGLAVVDVDALDKGEDCRLFFRRQVIEIQRVVFGFYRLDGLGCDRRGFRRGRSLNSRGGCRRSSFGRLFLFFAGKDQRRHGFIVHRHKLLFLLDWRSRCFIVLISHDTPNAWRCKAFLWVRVVLE